MASSLRSPIVPGVTSLGNILAQASQTAASNNAQILSATRGLTADINRQTKVNQDAVIQRRLEQFQEKQFQLKRIGEERRHALAVNADSRADDANTRAELKAPLERALTQLSIDRDPLQRSLISAQIEGSSVSTEGGRLRNDAATLTNAELPQRLERQAESETYSNQFARTRALLGQSDLDQVNEDKTRILEQDQLSVSNMTGWLKEFNEDPSLVNQTKMLDSMAAMKDSGDWGGERGRQIFNAMAQKAGFPPETVRALIIPGPNAPLGVGDQRITGPEGRMVQTRRTGGSLTGSGSSGSENTIRLRHSTRTDDINAQHKSKIKDAEIELDLLMDQLKGSRSDDKSVINGKIKTARKDLVDHERRLRNALTDENDRFARELGTGVSSPTPAQTGTLDNLDNFLKSIPGFDQAGPVGPGSPELPQQPANAQGAGGGSIPKAPVITPPRADGLPSSEPERMDPNPLFGGGAMTDLNLKSFNSRDAQKRAEEANFDSGDGTFVANETRNDGDSFLVQVDGAKQKNVRLYFVDTPESSDSQGPLNRKQADYFGIKEPQVTEVGKQAKEATSGWLSSERFEVHERNERIMGGERKHALIFFPEAPEGEQWLAERLVKRGLASVTAKSSVLPDGTTGSEFQKKLKELEKEAKLNKMGAWGL